MMQTQFIKQRHAASCGPTAIVNTMKWAGIEATLRGAYAKLVKAGKVLNGEGIHYQEFEKLLRKHLPKSVNIERIDERPFTALDAHMKGDVYGTHAAIVLYADDSDGSLGHYTFIPSRSPSGKSFTVTNVDDKAVTKKTRKFFTKNMRTRKIDGRKYPQVFLITKPV